MAPLITPVAAIVAGKINIKLRVRVVHVWTVSKFNNPNEDNSIHMLLLDDKLLGKIQASAKKHLVPRIRSNVEEGSTYDIENVLVTKNDPKYQEMTSKDQKKEAPEPRELQESSLTRSLAFRLSEVHPTSEDKDHVAAPQWSTLDFLDVRLSELERSQPI
ncbi:hypothetical protein MTR_5g080500 [Medicago truncatula]|uniref:Replication protein A 70 kDa DNA-binding subunit B/D first OB fold domain-containing protein n=1 Tax=Medicago truncatula TaxID=3880 RepID=G7KGT6_MEDTR|nr:hypothetical protein MTR_5g080500 [Medicago truncatula]